MAHQLNSMKCSSFSFPLQTSWEEICHWASLRFGLENSLLNSFRLLLCSLRCRYVDHLRIVENLSLTDALFPNDKLPSFDDFHCHQWSIILTVDLRKRKQKWEMSLFDDEFFNVLSRCLLIIFNNVRIFWFRQTNIRLIWIHEQMKTIFDRNL